MKLKIILMLLLLCSCAQNKISGYVKDFDSNKPIKDVWVSIHKNTTQTDSLGFFSITVTSNSSGILNLKKEGYESKKVSRKPDSLEKSSDNKTNKSIIYLFKNESEYSNKNR